MTKEYARFRKYCSNIKGYMYESVREDGRVYWKIMYDGCKFFCKQWKAEFEFRNWALAFPYPPAKICQVMREMGWTQIKGPKALPNGPRDEDVAVQKQDID